MNKIALLIIPVILTACMSFGTKVDPDQALQFKKGITTEADIVAALGAPNQRSTKPDGSNSIAYMSMGSTPDAALFIPYIGPFVGKVESKTTAVRFTFDPNGRLLETSTDTSTMRGGMFGGD